jgi:hypothetical protein
LAKRFACPVFAVLLMIGLCRRASAQATSDRVPAARTLSAADAVKAEAAESRFHLGPIRLLPFLAVSNAGYNNNLFDTPDHKVADYTATVAAGTRFVLPVGTRFYVRGRAAPEYVWYLDHPEGRAWGRLLDGEVLAFFNRVSLTAGGIDTKTPSILNTETFQNVLTTTQGGRGSFEVTIAGPLGIFAQGESTRYSFESSPPAPPGADDPAQLDRKEVLGRAGLKLSRGENANISLFAEEVTTTFDRISATADNRSVAYGANLYVNRHRFFFNLTVDYRKSTPLDGSSFQEFSTTTGSYFLSYLLRPNFELFADGTRGIQYSLTQVNPYYLSTRNGGGLSLELPHRIFLRGYGHYGENRYPIPFDQQGVSIHRLDKIIEWGGGIQFEATKRLIVGVLAYQDRYESNVPGVSRTYFRIASLISFELTPGVSIRGEFS